MFRDRHAQLIEEVLLLGTLAVKVRWFTSEGAAVEFRADFFNLFNRVNLTNPTSDLSSSLFGMSTSQSLPRAAQFRVHIEFKRGQGLVFRSCASQSWSAPTEEFLHELFGIDPQHHTMHIVTESEGLP